MGRIQRCSEVAQARFMRLCCIYWTNECVMSIEDAEIELGDEEFKDLMRLKIIQRTVDGFLIIKFLDEQYEDCIDISKVRSKAAKARWGKASEVQDDANAMQMDANAMQDNADKIREDENRLDDIRKDQKEKATHSFFQSQELNEVFSKWLYACANDVKPAIRKARGQSAIEALAVKLNCLPVDTAIKQVRQSLENGWVTLRPVDESKLKPDPNAPIIWEQKDIDDYMNNPFISNETKAAFLAERQSTNSLKLNA
jgi:hypothetical protein